VSERLSTVALPVPEPAPAPAADNGEPLVLGRYRLRRRLGAGGFGVVWLAHDERLQREVAVKAIPRAVDGDAPDGARAEREARVAARLNHPGIVALYELGGDEDAVYLVSELVDGRTFADLAAEGALSDRDVSRIGVALCDALAHAHEREVVHRDVKPQNVIVVAEPAAGAGFAKLADFGVAQVAGGDPLTRTGDVVGTLAYMAPEQAAGERATPAVDVYSLALTLYEGFTGSNPVRGRGPAATARRVGRPLPSLARRRRDLPAGLCAAVDTALDPRPERRLALAELRAALAEASGLLSDEDGLVERGAFEPAGERSLGARLAARCAAGLAAGGLVLAALERLGPEPPSSSLAFAGAAAVAIALFPRLGWAAAALGVCGWLASADVGNVGTAFLLAGVLAPVPLLLPRAGVLWSAPALAPLLGVAGIAPAYLALAGFASTAWRRAGLGALGALWIVAAEALTGTSLLYGPADGTLDRALWEGSLSGAAGDALYPALGSPALAPLVVWGALAAVLPLVVRGRALVLDLVGAGAWAAAIVVAHRGTDDLLAASTARGDARGAAAGAVLGACLAVAGARSAGFRRMAPDERSAEP
jgi:eukaryotic-like serine/threonine-protein kinase